MQMARKKKFMERAMPYFPKLNLSPYIKKAAQYYCPYYLAWKFH